MSVLLMASAAADAITSLAGPDAMISPESSSMNAPLPTSSAILLTPKNEKNASSLGANNVILT